MLVKKCPEGSFLYGKDDQQSCRVNEVSVEAYARGRKL